MLNSIIHNPWRQDFPLLKQQNRGKPLVYLDTAATAQKPQIVLDEMLNYYQQINANIHRGIYELSEKASVGYEEVRRQIAQFIGASTEEVIFTHGTTESLNAVAYSLTRGYLKAGDEIILTEMEHHSNLVPWQVAAEQVGAIIRVVKVLDNGDLDLAQFKSLFSTKTKVVAVTHASNVLGTINPIKKIAALAHEHGAMVVVDGAQAIAHFPVNVKELDCDFYAFSGHKLYGPTGVGVLYGKQALLRQLPPYQTGGGMINAVSFAGTTYADIPTKWEAGTPPIAEVIGLGAALRYLNKIGMQNITAHESALTSYALQQMKEISAVRLIGSVDPRVAVVSFVVKNQHAYDVGALLDAEGIAVRTGHHCTMPLHERFNVPATIRVSLGLYNDQSDINRFMGALKKVLEILK